MANKTLGTRQKLTFRIEPSQQKLRKPVAVAAKQRAAGPHKKITSAQRQLHRRSLLKKLTEPGQD
ncbi:hypothetical protein ACFQAT_02650 [Undibacterium arcticum]|uniref:Uncharacterized protein n=1 Tax=Undibacterium arcticum TaxID=1762892 RepID=A0ABV7F0V0_9BURK